MNDVAEREIAPLVEHAVIEALETMCFFGVVDRRAELMSGADFLSARMQFTGNADGSFRLVITAAAAAGIAANFLGLDASELSADQVNAVVCELANMVCGAALSAWDSEGTFSLSTPAISPFDPAADDAHGEHSVPPCIL